MNENSAIVFDNYISTAERTEVKVKEKPTKTVKRKLKQLLNHHLQLQKKMSNDSKLEHKGL